MADSTINRREWVQTALTIASIAVAALALWQSRAATEESRITSEKQAQMSDESLTLQKKTFDLQNPIVRIGLIQVWLQSPDADQYFSYPDPAAPEPVVVPPDEWASVSERWLNFSIANPGGVSFYINEIGIGANESDVRWADAADIHCRDPANGDEWSDDCPREIVPATEVDYSIYLTREILSGVDPDWQDKGVEVCVKLEAFNSTCDTSFAALPHDFLDALSPAPS